MYDFGPITAQGDPNLLKYFHVTNQIASIINDSSNMNGFIMVVRPGGGKTALYTWLNNKLNDRKVISINSDVVRFVFKDDNDATSEDHRVLISAELSAAVISLISKDADTPDPIKVKCKNYLDNFWETTWESAKSKFEGINILGCGFSMASSDRKSYLEKIRKEKKLDQATVLIREISSVRKIMIIVDNPESIVGLGLEDVTHDNGIRIGAFLSSLSFLYSLGIQVIAFVKEHIIQAVAEYYRDYNQYQNRIDGLEWTEDDLLKVVENRISTIMNYDWDDVFDIDKMSFANLVLPYLINGPRDLLYICDKSKKCSGKITKEVLTNSIDLLRNSKWSQIKNEFGLSWPKIDLFTKNIIELIPTRNRSGITKARMMELITGAMKDSQSQLYDLRKQEDWINSALVGDPTIEDKLFLIGAIGYELDGNLYYPWSGRFVDRFHQSNKVFISPLLI